MKAVLLVGGKATRLAPLSDDTPKCLLEVRRKPVLVHLFDFLKKNDITQVILAVGHLKDKIKDHIKDGSAYGMQVTYAEETEPLGTAGPLNLIKDKLQETFLVSNGDELKEVDIKAMLAQHKETGAKATLALHHVEDPSAYGVAKMDGKRITAFIEKPKKEDAPSNLINAGLYLLEPSVIDDIKDGFCMFETDVFPQLAKEGSLYGFSFEGQWFDTGTTERLAKARADWKTT